MLGFNRDEQVSNDKLRPVTLRHRSGVSLNLVNQWATGIKSLPLALEVISLPQTRSFLEYNDIDIVDTYEDDDRTALILMDPDNNIIELRHYQ